MLVLGELPNLRSLVLCHDAFVGKEMMCNEEGFPELTSLKLATLQFLEKLEVDATAMPKLNILTIEQCDKLEMPPYDLEDLPSLRKLMIGSMPEEFRSKVDELIEYFRSIGNDEPTATFYDC
ncbi:UNVERIFIED_CONTAM: hypothetical protein Sangu_3043700 [Sesamum angustifolium]|uniref:Uncharacterized protein n=1 Tax=Sesamum angustifolium TaxID=2727405 RepID=A0AAW2KFK8_9LAMI